MVIFSLIPIWPVFNVIVGVVVGILLRDLLWIRGIQRTWPFSNRVADWEKIRKIAAGLPVTDLDDPPNGDPDKLFE